MTQAANRRHSDTCLLNTCWRVPAELHVLVILPTANPTALSTSAQNPAKPLLS
jgi:hypothetical protein